MSRKLLALLLVGAFVLGVAGIAAADDENDDDKEKSEGKGRDHDEREEREGDHHGKPEFGERGDKFLLKNDQIAVWFHMSKNHAKPDLRITFNGSDNETSGYRVQILRLYEAPADDPHFKGSYPKINLAKSDDWNVQTEQTNESITLTMVRAEAQGIVTLVWHIDTVNATVKYDVKVDNWRWANASDHLVLDMLVMGKNLKNATGANVTVEQSGYITWATTAQATYGANDTRNLTVESYQKKSEKEDDDHDDDEHGEKSAAHILLVFNGTGGYSSLEYDPTFGVMSSSAQPVPGLGLVAVVGVGALAAIALRRRS